MLGFMGIQCTRCPLGLSNPIYVTVVATDFFFSFFTGLLIRPEGCPRSLGPVSCVCRQLHLGHWLSQHQLLVVWICKCALEILQCCSGTPCRLGEMQNTFFFPFSFKVKKYVYHFICFYCRNVVLFACNWQKVEQAADVFLRALKARVFRFPTRQNK